MGIRTPHVVVIGAGIGGLTTAALLARHGLRITLLEARGYPGGCAATFSRQGYRFDAGATVGCGFHPGGPMDRLGRKLGIAWPIDVLPVAWQYRCGDLWLDLSATRQDIFSHFPASLKFWQEQARLSHVLWQLAAEGLPWPTRSAADVALLLRRALPRLPSMTKLATLACRSTKQWLARHGLDRDSDFLRFLDAQLLISVQTTCAHANALYAAIALDLPSAGTCHIRGGMGQVAELLAAATIDQGGAIHYRRKVQRLVFSGGLVTGVETDDGERIAADMVVANLTPESLALLAADLLPAPPGGNCPRWSAFLLYLGLEASCLPPLPRHLQLVGRSGPLGEGNSLFVSVSAEDESLRAPPGQRAVTISTHSLPEPWFRALAEGSSRYQERKRRFSEGVLQLLSSHLPAMEPAIRSFTAATPVTLQRFTGRRYGLVGGTPQISLLRVRGPASTRPNLFLVGDSVFPGQSLPGVVSGAERTVQLALRYLGTKRCRTAIMQP